MWEYLDQCSHCLKDLGLDGPKLILTDFKHGIEGKPAGPTLILPVGDRGPALKALTAVTTARSGAILSLVGTPRR